MMTNNLVAKQFLNGNKCNLFFPIRFVVILCGIVIKETFPLLLSWGDEQKEILREEHLARWLGSWIRLLLVPFLSCIGMILILISRGKVCRRLLELMSWFYFLCFKTLSGQVINGESAVFAQDCMNRWRSLHTTLN